MFKFKKKIASKYNVSMTIQDYGITKKYIKLACSTCSGLSRDSKMSFSDTLAQFTLNPAPRGSGGQNPRHRKVGGSWMINKETYCKIKMISPGLMFAQKAFLFIFRGAYIRRGLLLEGILRFKMGWA